jgi:hypothetical protein
MPKQQQQQPSDVSTPAREEQPNVAGLQARMKKRSKRALWIAMVVGVVFGGAAFAYKIVEFLFTLSSPEARGFAEVPVTVYFFVAGGWLCLLAWCFASGQFKNLEQAKLDMLEMEEEYDRRGI